MLHIYANKNDMQTSKNRNRRNCIYECQEAKMAWCLKGTAEARGSTGIWVRREEDWTREVGEVEVNGVVHSPKQVAAGSEFKMTERQRCQWRGNGTISNEECNGLDQGQQGKEEKHMIVIFSR